jgi:hypothetical protein
MERPGLSIFSWNGLPVFLADARVRLNRSSLVERRYVV